MVVGSNYSNKTSLKKKYPNLLRYRRQGHTVRVQEKRKRKTKGRHQEVKKAILREDTIMPNSSHPIEKSLTENFVVGEPTISRKRKDTQS
jgi:hypothetical protein